MQVAVIEAVAGAALYAVTVAALRWHRRRRSAQDATGCLVDIYPGTRGRCLSPAEALVPLRLTESGAIALFSHAEALGLVERVGSGPLYKLTAHGFALWRSRRTGMALISRRR